MEHHERPLPPTVADRPADFDFMPAEEWLAFHCEVYDAIADLGLAVGQVDPGAVHLRDGRSIGLLQLAQRCHLREREGWGDLISSHLRTMTVHLLETVEPFSMFDLRIRLVPDDPADADCFRRVGARPFAEGVVQLLAVDVPGAVRCVPADEITSLGWDLDEAWRSAALQTGLLERPDEVQVVDVAGTEIVHVFSARPFVAGMVERIDELVHDVAPCGEFGAIVSIPLRHSILAHPVVDDRAAGALAAMVSITRRLHEEGPGAVSPHVYWWQHGTLTWIPSFHDDDGTTEAYLPPELVEAIESLPGPGAR